jgi:hypothetical protein
MRRQLRNLWIRNDNLPQMTQIKQINRWLVEILFNFESQKEEG